MQGTLLKIQGSTVLSLWLLQSPVKPATSYLGDPVVSLGVIFLFRLIRIPREYFKWYCYYGAKGGIAWSNRTKTLVESSTNQEYTSPTPPQRKLGCRVLLYRVLHSKGVQELVLGSCTQASISARCFASGWWLPQQPKEPIFTRG